MHFSYAFVQLLLPLQRTVFSQSADGNTDNSNIYRNIASTCPATTASPATVTTTNSTSFTTFMDVFTTTVTLTILRLLHLHTTIITTITMKRDGPRYDKIVNIQNTHILCNNRTSNQHDKK